VQELRLELLGIFRGISILPPGTMGILPLPPAELKMVTFQHFNRG